MSGLKCRLHYEKESDIVRPNGLTLEPETEDEKKLLKRFRREGVEELGVTLSGIGVLLIVKEHFQRGSPGGSYPTDYDGTFGYWFSWEKDDESQRL